MSWRATPTASRPIRGLLLDLDDTLLDHRSAARQAFVAWRAALAGARSDETVEEAFGRWETITTRLWLRHRVGEISFLTLRRERLREFLGEPVPDARADELFAPYRLAYERHWALVPDGAEFLRRSAHLPRVIVTNGPREMQHRKLAALGLADQVVGVVTPEDCGHAKPRPEIFHRALSLLGLGPGDCMMIGDDRDCDIEPARALGMASFQVDPGGCRLLNALSELG